MWILLSLFVLVIGLLTGWFLKSPGVPDPIVDENGMPVKDSLSEKVFVNINGVRQGMFIQSRDISQSVLLFVHGGMPEFFLNEQYPAGLEQLFTVVWWEQRGSGLSFNPDTPVDTLTADQLIADTLSLTRHLQQRFGKEKIYLMGHSGGTFIALQAAAEAPELYHAYLAVEQITYQRQSEVLAYEHMLQQYRANENHRMVSQLEKFPVTMRRGTMPGYLELRDTAMHQLGIGTTHEMKSVFKGIFLPSITTRVYTVPEKINLWRAKSKAGVSVVWEEMQITDLAAQVTKLEIPVYFFHGVYDYTVSYPLAKSYFETLEAPVKGFYTFSFSAHSPMFEEPKRMRQILSSDVLTGQIRLADSPTRGPVNDENPRVEE